MTRPTTLIRRLAITSAGLTGGLLLHGCSVHGTWESGTSTTSEPAAQEHRNPPQHARAPEPREHHEHPVVHAPPADHTCAADDQRCVAAKQRAADELAKVDQETAERVRQAEQDAADQERAADEQAERDRQKAQEEADQRQRDADAAAAAQAEAKPKVMRRADPPGTVFHKGPNDTQAELSKPAMEVLERRKGEINASNDDKKTAIRKKLEQNKADILVAAERKRNSIQAQLKQDAEQKP
jgi:hypothetical protein